MEKERIGSYRKERVLGDGGQGVVYLGRHEVLGRLAAIKTLLPRHAGNEHLRKRLLSEGKAQARLQHPNIVALYELFEDERELFIAMEYVEGETLAARLDRCSGGRMSLAEAMPLFEQLLEALEFVHHEKIVHRDVKPSNALIGSGDRLKLSDFGLALLAGEPRLTSTLAVPGTLPYMSPEQLQGKDVDHRSDIYSAALVLFRMLSGRAAFESKEYLAQLHERLAGPPDLATLVPSLPKSICEAVSIALQLEPARRFQSAAEFREELRQAKAGFLPAPVSIADETTVPRAVEASPPAPVAETEPQISTRPAAGLVTAGILTAAVVLLVVHLQRSSPAAMPKTIGAGAIAPAPGTTATQLPPDPPPIPPPKPPVKPTEKDDTAAQEAKRRAAAEAKRRAEEEAKRRAAEEAQRRATEEAKRRTEIAALRIEIQKEFPNVRADIRMEEFTAGTERLGRLERMTDRAPAELAEERSEIARLRTQLSEAEVAAAKRKHQEELWRTRIEDIEDQIRRGRFPEAVGIAEKVKNDPRAPSEVASRAEELLNEARKALVEAFQKDTRVGATTNKIRKPSSPPRKDD